MEPGAPTSGQALNLLQALDAGLEPLAAVEITSFLLHNRIEPVKVVTPADKQLQTLPRRTAQLQTSCQSLTIPGTAAYEQVDPHTRAYFDCIEAIDQVCQGPLAAEPGRHLCMNADTLCVRGLPELAPLPLSSERQWPPVRMGVPWSIESCCCSLRVPLTSSKRASCCLIPEHATFD